MCITQVVVKEVPVEIEVERIVERIVEVPVDRVVLKEVPVYVDRSARPRCTLSDLLNTILSCVTLYHTTYLSACFVRSVCT